VGQIQVSYTAALCEAMRMLAARPNSIFLGQGVGAPSTIQTDTLRVVPEEKRIEFPVAEELQMGVAIGMSLAGWLPISVYPRWDFLLLAAGQLVLHLDRIAQMTHGGFAPKVIVRVVAPATHPFDPGPQHDDDFTEAFRLMCERVKIITLPSADHVMPAYRRALETPLSTVLVEYGDRYDALPSGVMP
jgi:pyruvate/2-oxoglutarate/acetoin dehydrogenase E1 component